MTGTTPHQHVHPSVHPSACAAKACRLNAMYFLVNNNHANIQGLHTLSHQQYWCSAICYVVNIRIIMIQSATLKQPLQCCSFQAQWSEACGSATRLALKTHRTGAQVVNHQNTCVRCQDDGNCKQTPSNNKRVGGNSKCEHCKMHPVWKHSSRTNLQHQVVQCQVTHECHPRFPGTGQSDP